MDKKGIFTFLAVTLALSVAAQAVSMMTPLKWAVYFNLIAPVLGAVAARRTSSWPADVKSAIWPVPKMPAVRIAVVTPLIFAVVFILTTLVGLTRPDWRLGELMMLLVSDARGAAVKALVMPNMPQVMLVLGLLFTFLLGPTLIAAFVIGIEYGWRGYLLPRLMPLGKWRAYAALGLMWGLSMAPMRIANTAHSALMLLVLSLAMTILLSAILGEIWRRTHNIGLTAVFYGCFTTQATALLPFLFPDVNVLFPWGGAYGVVSIIAWAIVAAFLPFFFGKLGQPATTNTQAL
ncbi:MAG TPA: CPBP family glutamic-type intramembrane protease [Candidatus Bathyarchaeia archaeon]|nr:CPBP family glutamic-type intramembrane protease [Candidatus Bathyarchaeia archaeon]